jgi:hypothetical protein
MGVNSSKGFNFKLIASGSQLDLFQDETISVSNNVTGLFDIAVLPSEFTRQISIPGTKVNNAFFKHVYDISVENPYLFATNVKVPAYFDFDGFYISQGYLQLNKVNVRSNKFIESYEISIYGTLSSFSRDINKFYLTDLTTLSIYNHTASYDNVVNSWDGNLFSGSIVYPLCDYGTGWRYTAGQYETNGINKVEGGLTTQDFKPAIRAKAVMDAIFEYTGYTYSSNFLDEDWFQDVYMICNNSLKYPEFSGINLENYGTAKISAVSGSGMTDVVLTADTFTTLPWYNKISDPTNIIGINSSYNVQKSSALKGILNLNINVSCSVNNMPGTLSANGTWQYRLIETGSGTPYSLNAIQSYIFFFDQLQNSRTGGINTTYELQTEFVTSKLPVGNYYFQIKQRPNVSTGTLPTVTMDPESTTKSFLRITKAQQAADDRVMNIQNNMPFGESGIKLVDFIKGLQKKYNLVIYPDNTKQNHFIIEPFNSWYDRGEIKNFDRYINLDEIIEVVPANNLAVNRLQFGDTLGNDYIAQQFQKENTREFAKTYYTDTENFFSQGEFKIETTFSVTPLTYLTGTGLSGSAEGITPPSEQVYSYNFGNAGWGSDSLACTQTSYFPNRLYSRASPLTVGSTLYTDSGLTTAFNGGTSYWKFVPSIGSQFFSSLITTNGTVVSEPELC